MSVKRNCLFCGKPLVSKYVDAKFCGKECYKTWQREFPQKRRKTGSRHNDCKDSYLQMMLKAKKASEEARKARLSARDAAYAAKFPELATGECRGQVSAGSHLGKFGNMEADMLRKY